MVDMDQSLLVIAPEVDFLQCRTVLKIKFRLDNPPDILDPRNDQVDNIIDKIRIL